MRRMLGLAIVLMLALPSPPGAETAASDPRAVAIADQVMKALGGRQRWDSLHYLRWSFEVAVNDTLRPGRRHSWDKYTGWHRVDGTSRAGQHFTYIENLNDSTGMAWVNGNPIEGDSLGKLMQSAHAQWINDSYWFLMPYKLRDPGAHLKYDGEVKDGGAVYDRLALSFEHVGMTPGDRYWVYVNRANHRVEKWEHLLQDSQPPPVPWTWEGWEEHGGLWFATAHKNANRTLYTRAVETAGAPRPGNSRRPSRADPPRARALPPRDPRAYGAGVDATYRVSEIFHSIQGEGPSAGTPAHFVRLQGCGVGCHWCDTKYSWDAGAGRDFPVDGIWTEARGLGEAPLLVVTGGEPLEHAGLARLLEQGLERWPRVEVETSGLAPPPLSHPRLFYNVSPKLPSATPGWARTWSAAAAWVEEPNATFKIVVGDPPDPDDALRLVAEHRIPDTRVMLMPEGLTDERVRAHAQALAALCREHGFRMSPRLHVWLWGARRGV